MPLEQQRGPAGQSPDVLGHTQNRSLEQAGMGMEQRQGQSSHRDGAETDGAAMGRSKDRDVAGTVTGMEQGQYGGRRRVGEDSSLTGMTQLRAAGRCPWGKALGSGSLPQDPNTLLLPPFAPPMAMGTTLGAPGPWLGVELSSPGPRPPVRGTWGLPPQHSQPRQQLHQRQQHRNILLGGKEKCVLCHPMPQAPRRAVTEG